MSRRRLVRGAQTLAAVALFAALAVGAPIVNAEAQPPRSAFRVLPAGSPQPVVSLSARQLPSGRWRVTVGATHFQFTELCLLVAEAVPIGHAHILVDGQKVASAYQPFVDLDLPPGEHRVAAILRAQDHRALIGEDGLIKSEILIDVPST